MAPDWRDDLVDVRFTERAVAFIDQHAERRPCQPFFLYLTPSAPHRPCVPPGFMTGASKAGERGDMVALVDWMVGQIDDALARHDLQERTLVIVTSDNGARLTNYDGRDHGHRSNGNLRGQKADIWDGGHREPFIARWPGRIAPGSSSSQLTCLCDLMATCADLLGADLPASAAQDSYSFLHALVGEPSSGPVREALVHHSGNGMFSLRKGRWKLIRGLGSGGFSEPKHVEPVPGGPLGQLYDMESAWQETGNGWLEHPMVVEELSHLLDRYQSQGFSRPGARP